MSNSVNLSVHLKKTFLAPWGNIYILFFWWRLFPPFSGLCSLLLLCGSSLNVVAMWFTFLNVTHDWPPKSGRWDECSTFETTNLWFQNGTPVSRDFHMSKIHILHPFRRCFSRMEEEQKRSSFRLRYWVATSNCIFEKCEQSWNKN